MKTDHPTNIYGNNALRTRDDFQHAARDLFEPLVPYYRAGGARVILGNTAATYDEASEGLEAFIRSLWSIVPLTTGGGHFDHWDLIRTGLINGTDPKSDQYWGAVGQTAGLDPTTDQRMVEMAAFGLAMALTPGEFFEPLTDQQKQNVFDWLAPINTTGLRDNNWQFFRVLVNLGFERVGGPVDRVAVEQSLATLESNYLGDGWYQDGATFKTTDFYIPFAFHFYSLIYARLAESQDPDRAAEFRERARIFSPDWAARFDASGRVIAYGRSMTYRFAGAGFFGALAFAGVEGVPWSTMRSLWAKHMRWWAYQPIVNAAGVLTIGWAYDNLLMSETYNAPGSPYWALKAFLPLALPADHPFWTAEEDPDAGADELHLPQPHAQVVVNRTSTQSQMLNAGGPGFWFPRQGAAKYGKFAYSSAFPFAVEPDDTFALMTAESNLAFVDESRRHRQSRLGNIDSGVDGDIAWAEWQVFDGDVRVRTALAGHGAAHARIHVVDTTRTVTAVEGGFAIEWRYDPTTDEYESKVTNAAGQASSALVGSSEAVSAIVDPTGSRTAAVVELQPNTSLQWARSAAPVLSQKLAPGRYVFVAVVEATEKPGTVSNDVSPLSEELWAKLDEVVGERVGRPALR